MIFTLLMVLRTLILVLRTVLMVLHTLFLVLRTLLMVLRTLFLVLRRVWLDKPIMFLKPYRFWLIGVCFWLDVVFVLFIHPVLRTPLKRGILEAVLVFLEAGLVFLEADMAQLQKPYRFWLIDVCFWLDAVFVLFIHPVLRTPLKRGILDGVLVLLGVCGFWLAADMAQLQKPIRFLKPYRFWLKGVCFWLDVVFDLFIHPVLRTPLKRGIWDGDGFLLDVVFVLFIHPVLRTPLKRGILEAGGFWNLVQVLLRIADQSQSQ